MRPLRRRRGDPDSVWFWDHYETAAREIVSFLAVNGIPLDGRRVADVGCGDGIMALGLAARARPLELVGYDVNLTDTALLLERARREGVARELPPELRFEASTATELPAADGTFDVVSTWSAFEHITDPRAVLGEIRRVLKPDGVLFLQLWPFYHSERGSHLWDWFPEGFHHLGQDEDEVVQSMTALATAEPGWTGYMAGEFRSLNRLTLDELGDHLTATGFSVAVLELLTHRVHLPSGLSSRFPLSQLGVGGVKLLARPN